MLHKMQVAVLDKVFFFLEETVLNQRCMNVYAQHFEWLLEYLGSQISIEQCRVPCSAADIQKRYLIHVFALSEQLDKTSHCHGMHHS